MSDQYGIGYVCDRCRERHNPFDLCPTMFPTHCHNQMFRRAHMPTTETPITKTESSQPECTLPPKGWRCTRGAGHSGPCAAVHESLDPESVEQRADKMRVAAEKAVRDWNAYSRQPDVSGWEKHRASMKALHDALQ